MFLGEAGPLSADSGCLSDHISPAKPSEALQNLLRNSVAEAFFRLRRASNYKIFKYIDGSPFVRAELPNSDLILPSFRTTRESADRDTNHAGPSNSDFEPTPLAPVVDCAGLVDEVSTPILGAREVWDEELTNRTPEFAPRSYMDLEGNLFVRGPIESGIPRFHLPAAISNFQSCDTQPLVG